MNLVTSLVPPIFPFLSGMIWAGCTIWQYLPFVRRFYSEDSGKNTDLAFSLEDLIFYNSSSQNWPIISRTNVKTASEIITLWSKHRKSFSFPMISAHQRQIYPVPYHLRSKATLRVTAESFRCHWWHTPSPGPVPMARPLPGTEGWLLLRQKFREARTENPVLKSWKKVKVGSHKQEAQCLPHSIAHPVSLHLKRSTNIHKLQELSCACWHLTANMVLLGTEVLWDCTNT